MAKNAYLQDEQRVTLAEDFLLALQDTKFHNDTTAQEIASEFNEHLTTLKARKEQEAQASRMSDADAVLDACFQGLASHIEAIQRKAFVKGEEHTYNQAKAVQKKLFPKGISAIIELPYKAEAAQTQAFLRDAKDSQVVDFLQAHQLEEWLTLLEASHQDYILALNEFHGSKEERKAVSEQASAARKHLDKTFTRFLRYTRAKYPDGHALAPWRQEHIEAPLERAEAAALAFHKPRTPKK